MIAPATAGSVPPLAANVVEGADLAELNAAPAPGANPIAWLVWRAPRALRTAYVAVPAALLGAAPWIVWNARNG